jgi:hypothetical protein
MDGEGCQPVSISSNMMSQFFMINLRANQPFFGRYYTTLVCAFSQEVGTLSNGSIALKRILNGARSPRANLHFFLKFGIRVKLETIDEFKNRLFEYVKSKPREWIRPVAFRLNQISADLGYTEYFVLLNHRGAYLSISVARWFAAYVVSIVICFHPNLPHVLLFSYQRCRIVAKCWRSQELVVRRAAILF